MTIVQDVGAAACWGFLALIWLYTARHDHEDPRLDRRNHNDKA